MKSCLEIKLIIVFCLIGYSGYGQTVTLKGKVTDGESGNPLEFANIALLSPPIQAL